MKFPQIIQGGMGIGISSWQLARSVASSGELGVVSSTAIDLVMVRALQLGDPQGDIRRAMAAFPDPAVIQKILKRYFIDGGKPANQPFAAKPMVSDQPSRFTEQLVMVANFCEVHLAKEGHEGMVGINFLHKIQTPIIAGIYGAMLAQVDVVIVGAGIPIEIPKVINGLSRCAPVEFALHVHGAAKGTKHTLKFDPRGLLSEDIIPIQRPLFFPIVSSYTLASVMVKKSGGIIDGLIIEEPSAGGHNAPPRGKTQLNDAGEPVYGPRDSVDLEAIKTLGIPFWLAGSYATPAKLAEARAAGAEGVQLGTVFAFTDESGMLAELKENTIQECLHGSPRVFRDPVASPTGFPFQVLSKPGTLSEHEVYNERCRTCDLGYLREAYEKPDGSLGWRCRSEDPEVYVKKGGDIEDTVGRKCLCNSLMANIGMPQLREQDGGDFYKEPPLITCGEDLTSISLLTNDAKSSYTAAEVIDYMLTR